MKRAAVMLATMVFLYGATPPKQPYTTWSDYGGAADSMRYSGLKQIHKTNVNQLEPATLEVRTEGDPEDAPLRSRLRSEPRA
jgi:glucose dehydrogenase